MEQEKKKEILEGIDEKYREMREELREKEQELEELDDWEMSEEEYDDYLDGIQGDIDILGINYSMSNVLRNVDEVRYDMGKGEEEDRIREEKREELEQEIAELKEQVSEAEN